MPHSATIRNHRSGSTLIFSIIFLTVIGILVATTFDRSNANVQTTSRRVNDQEATRIAEAGIEKAVWCLNNPSNTTDCSNNPSFVGESNVAFGRGSFSTTVSGSGNNRTIDAYGSVGGGISASTQHLQVQLTTSTADVSFSYGLQAGIGGLDMKNNNLITGNVFSSGPVTGDKSAVSGDVVLTKGSPTIDATADPDPATNTLNFGTNGSSDDYLAQSFVPSVSDKIYSLGFKVAKVSSLVTSTITVYLYDDNSGQPGSELTGGGITLQNPIVEYAGWENSGWTTVTFTPAINPILTAGQTYWLVLKTSGADGSKYWESVRDADNSSYPSGQAKIGGSLTSLTNACSGSGCDIAFQVFMGGVTPTLKIGCTGVLCIDGSYAIGGNAYSETIDSTNIKQHACYQHILGAVTTGSGTETCTDSSTAPIPCDNNNTTYDTGPYCHAGNATLEPVGFPLTTAQIGQMEAQAANGNTIDCTSGCTISSGSIGPAKYDGDVLINGNVTLTGTVWVKGNLTIDNTITLSEAYGSDSGTIVADNPDDDLNSGRIIVLSGGNAVGNSSADTYIMLLSMNKTTSDLDGAIDVSNNLTAGVVYAHNGSVVLKNSADLKEVTGQRIVLQNGSQVTYETGLASVVFSSGPGGSWVYKKGSYQVIK